MLRLIKLDDGLWLHKWFTSLFNGYFLVYFSSSIFHTILACNIFKIVSVAVSIPENARQAVIKDKSDVKLVFKLIEDLGTNVNVISKINEFIKYSEVYTMDKDSS